MNGSSLQDLEKAIAARNPFLLPRLKPGLPESDILQALNQANVTGEIDPIIRLYAWWNGTVLDTSSSMREISFFPIDLYHFLDLESALVHLKSLGNATAHLQAILQDTGADSMFSSKPGRFFPFFFDGATGSIALDLTPEKQNQVVVIDFESDEPIRQAYSSFEDFVKDAIQANRQNRRLSCFH